VMTFLAGSGNAQLDASLSSGLDPGFRPFRVPAWTESEREGGRTDLRSVHTRLQALMAAASGNTISCQTLLDYCRQVRERAWLPISGNLTCSGLISRVL